MYKIRFLYLCSVYFTMGLSLPSNSQNIEADSKVCLTETCMKASNKILSYMNETVNPCDDFYAFACGKFERDTVIPDDKSSVTSFSLTEDEVDEQLRSILTEEPKYNETKAVSLAKIFTKSCLNQKLLNEQGVKPLVEIIESYGGWPTVKGDNWKADNWDWLKMSKTISKDGSQSLVLKSHVTIDLKNSSKRIISINRAEFGLERKFLLKGMEHKFVKAYYDFMVDAAVIFGANRTNAEFESLDVLQFESELAKMSLTDEERRNKSLIYNPFTINELQTTFPFINWLDYINWHLQELVQINETEVVNVVEKNYLSQLNAILQSTSKRTIANYYAWRLVLSYSKYLNDVLHIRNEKYESAITGQQKSLPRITECVKLTMTYLSISVGASYVQRYFDEQTKQIATELTKTIHEEFIDTLDTVPWMDEISRAAAIVKAKNMHFHIAFPDELIDDTKLEKYHENLELHPDTLLRNILNIHKFFGIRSINKLRKSVNKTDWETHSRATTVNAFYSSTENSIQLPAAILQSPFFSAERPAYMNFAAIGWFIAHEVTHGFDDEGRQFDVNGNVMNWWQQNTIEQFTTKAQCFIEQYSSYTHPILNLTVNGVITQGENIADNGAIKGTYAAYQKFTHRNGPDATLPGLNYTANQLFWISAAQTWCAVTRPESDTLHYTTNVHAPPRFRILGTFQNAQHFSNDFNCAPATPMNPTHRCEIW